MTLAQKNRAQQEAQLRLLILWFGSQGMTANKLGVSKQAVNNWLARGRISAVCAIRAEIATNGDIKKKDLRPDVIEWVS